MGQAERKYAAYYTIEQWEHWQDQWELIFGVPYCMSPAPSIRHQEVNLAILSQLKESLRNSACRKCKVLMPVDWQISEDTVVQPDVLIVCKPVKGNRLTETPEVVFEVLSPSTEQKDRTEKFNLYRRAGVKYYVLVDPLEETVKAFEFKSPDLYVPMSIEKSLLFKMDGCEVQLELELIWE